MKRASLVAGRVSPVCALVLLSACADKAPNGVIVELAPEVISSIDGTTHVSALVIDDRVPLGQQPIRFTVAYTDRNGTDHAIDGATGETDSRGAFEATITGLAWEGTGTITAEVLDDAGAPLAIDGDPVAATATFSVLDRTPPAVEILPPTTDLHVGPGLPLEVQVHVTDEIGVASVLLEAAGELERQRSTVVASGTTDATVTFRLDIPDNALPGPTITLYALASDLSNNQAAAEPVVLIVDPSVAIATPPGLDGGLISEGSGNTLDDPRALAVSPMDGFIYVADNSGGSPCNGHCIRKVNASTGAIDPAAVVVGNGQIEGVAFDASGNTLYYTDRQDRLMSMAWNSTNSRYENALACNDVGAQFPRSPYHLVRDASLGVMVADGETQRLLREADCSGNDPTEFSTSDFGQPRGVAIGGAGEFYVSDRERDRIYLVDRGNGAVSTFEDRNLNQPLGIDWLAGGSSPYADSLLVANNDPRTVESTRGTGTRPVAYLRNRPLDVAVDGNVVYILTQPSFGDPGRIFAVNGF